jgi:hypothetical protein
MPSLKSLFFLHEYAEESHENALKSYENIPWGDQID